MATNWYPAHPEREWLWGDAKGGAEPSFAGTAPLHLILALFLGGLFPLPIGVCRASSRSPVELAGGQVGGGCVQRQIDPWAGSL